MLRAVSLALVLCLACAATAAAQRPRVPRDWLGVVVDGPLTDTRPLAPDRSREWDRLARSGATSVRTAFYWHVAQRAGPRAFDLSRYDALVLTAARRGLGVLPVVLGVPGWAAAVPGDPGSPPRDVGAYGRFLRALVARYGPRGSLWREHPGIRRRPIRAWQIWNEPNILQFWSRQPFENDYARLVSVAHRALRRADPGATVVLAGLTNVSWNDLDRIYRAGARGSFDAVAIHPYTAQPRNVIQALELVRAVMARYGDARKPLWVTELSWPASLGKPVVQYGIETDLRGQVQRLREGLRRLAAARRRLAIRRVFWYTWLSYEGHRDTFGWAGLRRLRTDGRVVTAPALRAFRRIARRVRDR